MKSRLESLVSEMVDKGILFEEAVEEFQKHFILAVLRKTKGNLSKAAQELHIHRNTLSKRVEKYFQNGNMVGARLRRPRAEKTTRAASKAAGKGK